MARGRLSMKLIEQEKTRGKTFKKRVESLKKKAYEFSVLCDVEVCMIIFEPNLKDNPGKVQVWPSDSVDQITETIRKYIDKCNLDIMKKKIFSIFDFFTLRKKQVHDQVAQVRLANFKANFPTWDHRIDDLSSPEEINSLLAKLDLKLQVVKRKIALMKGDDDRLVQCPKFISPYSDYIKPNYVPELPDHSNLDFGISRDPLVNLTLSLKSTDKSPRFSTMNNFDFGAQSGIVSSSSSGIPNNVMYNSPPALYDYHQRLGMTNNNVMVNGPPSIPVLHDPMFSANAMQHNLMFRELKAPFQAFLYNTPSMQPETSGAYNYNQQQQQLMMPFLVPQMLPSDQFTDFYHEINEFETNKNKRQRFLDF